MSTHYVARVTSSWLGERGLAVVEEVCTCGWMEKRRASFGSGRAPGSVFSHPLAPRPSAK